MLYRTKQGYVLLIQSIQHIGLVMNNVLGKRGSIESLTDYWTVATIFQMSILTLNWVQVLKAAYRMFQILYVWLSLLMTGCFVFDDSLSLSTYIDVLTLR